MHAENNNFASRIDLAVKNIGNIGEACDAAGITYTTLARWKDGTSDPKMSNIIALATAAKVDLNWLMLGTGSPDGATQSVSTSQEDDYVYIPVYDIEVSAGAGFFTNGVHKPLKHLAFLKTWMQRMHLVVEHTAAFYTKGDSMAPTIPENGIIVVNTERNKALDGRVYVIRIEDRLYVKRTQWLIGGGLRLISDNKQYEPLDIRKEELENLDIEICGQMRHGAFDLPE